MAIIICSICLESMDESKRVVAIKCGHIYHELCLMLWKKQSKNCPDCRKTIHGAKRVYLNVSTTDDFRKKSIQNKLEKINELNRQKISDLTAAGQKLQSEIDTLQDTVHELSRRSLLDAGKHTIEMRNLEQIVNDQRSKYRDLRNLARLKDQTISELNTALKLRGMRAINDSSQMQQMRAENAKLIDRISQLNHCINTLSLGSKSQQAIASQPRTRHSVRRTLN